MNRLDRDHVRLHIDARADLLYDLVSDVTRTPQWSPEVISCTWRDGATGPVLGARFTARNKRRWFVWSNVPVVDTAEPGKEFGITRSEPGGGTIRWYYRLEPSAIGTVVELGYQVVQPVSRGLHLALRVLFGVKDLRTDLHQNMTTSLRRLAEIAQYEPAEHHRRT
jgi:hypothetical protein